MSCLGTQPLYYDITEYIPAARFWLFVVLCGYHHKNQRDLELKIILPVENGEEPYQVLEQEGGSWKGHIHG